MKRLALAVVITGCGPVVGDAGDASRTTDATMSPPTTSAGTSVSSSSETAATSPPAETTAPPIDDTSTTDPTSADGGRVFIEPHDAGGSSLECDQWTQDCPRGEKCMPWANDGGSSWNAFRCTPIDPDPKDVGEPCSVVESAFSGIDDCVLGATCWDVDPDTDMGTCVALCHGSEANPLCADPCTFCNISARGLILCLPGCNPLAQDCSEGQACYPIVNAFACAPDVSGDAGAVGDECEFLNVCDPGLFCANGERVPGCENSGCCAPFCDVDASDDCDAILAGTSCVPWFESGEGFDGCFESRPVIGACLLPP